VQAVSIKGLERKMAGRSQNSAVSMQSRNHALDGIRGLAALAVALGHSNLAVTGLGVWKAVLPDFPAMSAGEIVARLLYVVFPNDPAVTLFFVLSGHVLWASFARHGTGLSGLPDYVIGRAYRLLPVAIAGAIPFAFLVNSSAGELAMNMLLLSTSINGVLWSLQVEVICSLAIFGAWIVVRGSPIGAALLFVAVGALAPAFRGSNFFLFFPAFLLGAAVFAVPERMLQNRAIFFGGLAFLVVPSLFLSHSAPSRAFEMVGAAAMIGATRANPLPVLTSRPVLFLGAVSYPFYVTHTAAVLTVERAGLLPAAGEPFLRMVVLAAGSITLSLCIAWLLHVAVELPAMRGRPLLRLRSRPSPETQKARLAEAVRAGLIRCVKVRV
jgi:peptidoglycan/LPS O-acetylase OafA/YrhL